MRGNRCVPAAAGNDAQRQLRQPAPATRRADAPVAGHGDFQPPAQGKTVDGHDDRLGIGFKLFELAGQCPDVLRIELSLPLGQGLQARDIRAGDEIFAGAGDHHGADAGVFVRFGHAGEEPFDHGRAERIDRRRIDSDQGHVATTLEMDYIAHVWLSTIRFSMGVRCEGRGSKRDESGPRTQRGIGPEHDFSDG